jgi:sugar (pentulose or hexulose) kinase
VSHSSTPTATHVYSRRDVIGRTSNGQPRTYRLSPSSAQNAAYRQLAAAILGLDVATLASELRSMRLVAVAASGLESRAA